MGETEGKRCFVIMPFSRTKSYTEKKWTEFFNEWIKPAVEGSNLGLFCERSHPTTGDVIRDIVRKLYSAEAVVAILTDQSANVFWELGVRHSLRGTNAILFAEKKKDVPSNLHTTCAWHPYRLQRKEKQQFKRKLKALLKKVLLSPSKPDNPVAQFLEEEAELSVVDFEDETSFFNDLLGAIEKNKVGEMEKCLAYINQTAHEKTKRYTTLKTMNTFINVWNP